MKLAIIICSLVAVACNSSKQWDQRNTQGESSPLSYGEKIQRYQDSMNHEYSSGANEVFLKEDLGKKLKFYPPNEKYRVKADFEYFPNGEEFEMKTSTDRLPMYRDFGLLSFEIEGDSFSLHLYQNVAHPEYLFCPFKDITNGEESYGAGRYLDFELSDTLNPIIDFNYCYNPLCAYNYNYSCPIPPNENYLHTRIEAGVKKWEH